MATGNFDLNELKRRMQGAVQSLKHELGGLRTGRASAHLLDPIQVEAYGSNMPLNQVATVSVPEPRTISVQVWDRSNVSAVEKAIRNSNLGINPIVDGQNIRLPIPELTEERRKELSKLAHQYGEKAKIAVRNVRRDGIDQLKQDEKKHEISEDERKRSENEVQKLTDEKVAEIDAILAAKDKEILQKRPPIRPKPDRTSLPSPGTSPSSWTAMAAGQNAADCRASPAIALEPRLCAKRCRPRSSTGSRC